MRLKAPGELPLAEADARREVCDALAPAAPDDPRQGQVHQRIAGTRRGREPLADEALGEREALQRIVRMRKLILERIHEAHAEQFAQIYIAIGEIGDRPAENAARKVGCQLHDQAAGRAAGREAQHPVLHP